MRATFSIFLVLVVVRDEGLVPFLLPDRGHRILVRNTFRRHIFAIMRFFDPNDELLITQRKLPHWAQAGSVVFITWRTADSMPSSTVG